ncbi:hypothetical protein IAT40_007244 [Kwoniella sp. CBS 6097]
MPKNAVGVQLDPDNWESESESDFEKRMKKRKKNPHGSLPISDTRKYFKDLDPEVGIPLKVYLHISMSSRESLLTPYCPIVPGANNFWFIDYDEEWLSPESADLREKDDLYHIKPFQESFIEFAESKFFKINTTLTIYKLTSPKHAQQLKGAVNCNEQRMKASIKSLCMSTRKAPWMDDLSKTAKPKKFGPSNMYQISLARGIELMSYEVGGLRVISKNFNPEDGDEACPACEADKILDVDGDSDPDDG